MIRAWFRRLRGSFSTASAERELEQEFQSHLQMQIDDYVQSGMSPEAARRAALVNAGGFHAAKEDVRDRRGLPWISNLLRDARYGVRFLSRSPAFACAAVLSLALGIGANTAIFSILDALLLKPLPVSEPNRLAQIYSSGDRSNFTNPIWEQYRARPELAESLAAYSFADLNLADHGKVDRIKAMWVSGRFFDVLAVKPLMGRTLTTTDDQRGGGPDGPVAVISEGFWRARLNSDPQVLGRRITFDQVAFTIVGVTPAKFFGPLVGTRFDAAIPLSSEALLRGSQSLLDQRSSWWLRVIARLRPDQTVAQLSAAVAAVHPQIREATMPTDWRPDELPQYLKDPARALNGADGGRSYIRSQYSDALSTVMVVVAFVLLIACVNIANLLLARADARTHELSVRLALGASRPQLVRQLLVESFLLAAAGSALALVFAQWSSAMLVNQLSTWADPIQIDLRLDWRVLGFTAGVAFVVTMLFGLAPAMKATRVQASDALKERGRGERGHARWGVGSALVVMQVALCVALVIAAGLFARTFSTLSHRSLGFDTDRVMAVTLASPQNKKMKNAARIERYERARAAVAAVPGVKSTALSALTPFANFQWQSVVSKQDAPSLTDDQRQYWLNSVSPRYFETSGTALKAGVDVSDSAATSGPQDVVVNEAFVRQFLPGRGSGVGQAVHEIADAGQPAPELRIVGVVEDALYDSIRDVSPPTMYVALGRMGIPATELTLSVKLTDHAPASVVSDMSAAIAAVTPELSFDFRPMAEQVNARLVRERTIAILASFFGGLAVVLAGLGLFGVVSYGVSRRRTEIGIRLALGAKPSSVVWLVGSRAGMLVGAGLICGIALSWWAAKFSESLLYGLKPTDPLTFLAAALVLAGVGVLAAAVPAFKAARTDAARVLREG